MILEYGLAIIASILLLSGALFSLVAALGLIRLPDVYSRMHAASKAGTVGSGLILLGYCFQVSEMGLMARALATLFFLVTTAPVAAHLLARAACLAHDPAARRLDKHSFKNQG